MKRNLTEFEGVVFDLAIIGGGVYGAALAWEAASRGLSVALLEKGDFAGATSSNSLKIIHGGFRYLQHADFRRMRTSILERKILMRIAPHLVHPLSVLVPTFGHGIKGREMMTVALLVNDAIGFDRNRLDDPQKYIPMGRTISRQECIQYLSGYEAEGLSGGAIFYDAQVYNSERLVLAYLLSATQAGAVVANYARVDSFLFEGQRIAGVQVTDVLGGGSFSVRARTVVNTSGPWITKILQAAGDQAQTPIVGLAMAMNLVTRPLFREYAIGLAGRNGYQDDSSPTRRDSLLFIAPWRDSSLIGTHYQVYPGDPDSFVPSTGQIRALLEAINQSVPTAHLEFKDVRYVHAGLLPALNDREPVRLADHPKIQDHAVEGFPGLLSVIGVKYTTARNVAEQVVNYLFNKWGYLPSPCVSRATPLDGGRIERFDEYLQKAIQKQPYGLGPKQIQSLVYNYGSNYLKVLHYLEKPVSQLSPGTTEQELFTAQIKYAIHHEMAFTLSDIVFRRTELGTAGKPQDTLLFSGAKEMSHWMGWDDARQWSEIKMVEDAYCWMGE